jgi:hypothetical protein
VVAVSESSTDAYPVPFPGLEKKLVLTYDGSVLTDGAGAQLQRIYGTYAIARLLGAAYLHSPLRRVDYQGLSALERNAGDPAFHDALNEVFPIPSDVSQSDEFHEVRLRDISMETVTQLAAAFDRHETEDRPILAHLVFPYGIADRFPDCYEVCKGVSPFASTPPTDRVLRVAVHVRRGDLLPLKSDDRMLPNAYFIQVAQQVVQTLNELEIEFQIELYTEVPDETFVVTPEHHGIEQRISGPFVFDPGLSRLDEFSVLPNLVPCLNGEAADCLRGLATADVLVMSRSSFSYLGGILNRNCVVLYHPFWHSPPSPWLAVDPDGHFDQSEFSQAVETLGCRPVA